MKFIVKNIKWELEIDKTNLRRLPISEVIEDENDNYKDYNNAKEYISQFLKNRYGCIVSDFEYKSSSTTIRILKSFLRYENYEIELQDVLDWSNEKHNANDFEDMEELILDYITDINLEPYNAENERPAVYHYIVNDGDEDDGISDPTTIEQFQIIQKSQIYNL